MNNSLNNTKGIDKSKVLLIITVYNIIIYLGSFLLVGFFAVSIWSHMIPWTLIILILISIINIFIDVKNISIKLNSGFVILSIGVQILALMWFVFTPTTTFFSYHFIMLIALILIIVAYYIAYKNRIIDNTEARKNYISYILALLVIFSILVLGGLYFYLGWLNSPAEIPQEYNENTIQPEY